MNGLKVDKNLFMINDDFGDVQLLAAHIGGLVALKGSKVAGMLLMEELEAGSTIFLSDGAEFDGPINLVSGKFGGSVELAGGAFKNTVDLTGAQIGGELRLGSSQQNSAHWTGDSSLILRNAKADAIQDLSDSRPARLDLNGFSYRSLGGSFAAEKDPMFERPIDWFKSWLGRQKPYTPAPYEQLATVLRNTGNPEFATDILYAGKEREREQSRSLR